MLGSRLFWAASSVPSSIQMASSAIICAAMKPYLVIGGGVSGLIAASALKRLGIDFIGLEKSDQLGGRAQAGHHRLYDAKAVEYLQEQVSAIEWDYIQDSAQERFKGNWRPLSLEYSEPEQFYLGSPYYSPKGDFSQWINSLSASVRPFFLFHQTVSEIIPTVKKIICQEEKTFEYEKIIWASPLALLAKTWKGDKSGLASLFKKASDAENGGINYELEVKMPLAAFGETFPGRNTAAFTFRFKDHTLRALGIPQVGEENHKIHWMLFLPKKILENREEVAKCVRALKREIFKEFGSLQERVVQEKIIFLPHMSGDLASPSKSIEILPDTFYVGPELASEDTDESLRNMDRVVANCRNLEQLVTR